METPPGRESYFGHRLEENMPSTRQSLRLLSHEDEFLRKLYREFNITTDDYPSFPGELVKLVDIWNGLTGREEAAPDVLHYMVTKRKNSDWVRLGRKTNKQVASLQVSFSVEELNHLDAIHESLQIASDNFALNSEDGERLQQEFARRTGRIVPAMILAAAMIRRRKDGVLATLRPKAKDSDRGFADINEIAN
jgi:hypothetical protein